VPAAVPDAGLGGIAVDHHRPEISLKAEVERVQQLVLAAEIGEERPLRHAGIAGDPGR